MDEGADNADINHQIIFKFHQTLSFSEIGAWGRGREFIIQIYKASEIKLLGGGVDGARLGGGRMRMRVSILMNASTSGL